MDLGTHALASFALARTAFPRAPRWVWPIAVSSGMIADVDAISALFSPSAYIHWHRTYSHSLLGAALLAVVVALVYRFVASPDVQSRFSATAVFALALSMQCLHLALDVCQPYGALLFWPFSAAYVSGDWLAFVDPLILLVLIAAVLLPLLFHLVSSEIGAKDKKPRGQLGAIIALSVVALYIGGRALLHSNAVTLLESSTYRGELPRRVAAFPITAAPGTWSGIVETESALHEIKMSILPRASFNSDSALAIHKPDASPVLDAVRNDSVAAVFLGIARFPIASVEKTQTGYRVEIRDLRDAADPSLRHAIAALFELDSNGKIVSHELKWVQDLRRP